MNFGVDKKIVYSSNENKAPISQIRMEVDKPCKDPKGVSSLKKQIYQVYEYN